MVGNVGTVRVFCQNNIQNLVSRGQAPLQGLVSSSSALVILHTNNNILHRILFDLLSRKEKFFVGRINFYLSCVRTTRENGFLREDWLAIE